MRLATLFLPLACSALLAAQTPTNSKITGPYTHDNLSVLLIHGDGPKQNYLTLQQALAQKKVIVHETKNVNELTVENVSDQEVYIQGGDIVKGGEQDRTLKNDYVLGPKSGKLPVSAFCVESGRWERRGSEPAKTFNSSEQMIATKDLKVAVNAKNDQSEVWRQVENAQVSVATNAAVISGVNSSVGSKRSPSSLQLTLESEAMVAAVAKYTKPLSGVAAGKDAVGVAFVINGEINSADVYASPELFAAMWPKLLRAGATEAVRLFQKGKAFPQGSPEAVQAFLRAAADGKTSNANAGKTKIVTRETDKELVVESLVGDVWVHRNYVKK